LGWSTLALTATVALICGCGGSSFNPTPSISGLFPAEITAGSQAFTLFLSGNSFQSNTTVQWNGVNRPAVFNDTTDQMAVTILNTDVAVPGSGQLTVANPAPGGGMTVNAASFLINPPAANGPAISAISPASAVVGAGNVMITVTASNLASADVILFNGTPLTTSTVGSPVTQLTATIGSENLASQEMASIAVQTSTPGVASPSVKFPIGPSSNPSPRLTSITPANTKIGSLPSGSYLLLTGSGFVPGSVANFNGSPRPTGYSSSTQLAVGILASDVAGGGTIAVTVSNPNPGGGASSAVNFSVQ
jgi:hypothetical protein